MLKSLDLKNFQCHALTKIEFDPQVTCVMGPTDAGKSAILRALRWTCLNDLGGEGFIREGEKEAKVRLKVDDHVIIRAKGKENVYELDGKEFKAFGQGVPPEIEKVLGVNEINFQAQHDSPFWFNETAGEVSRRLNAVIDLSVIDSTLSAVSAAVRTAQERKGFTEERLTEAKTELEKIQDQKERITDFQKLQDTNTKYERFKKDCRVLGLVVGDLQTSRVYINRQQSKVTAGQDVLALGKTALLLEQRHGDLHDLLERAGKLESAAVAPADFGPVEKHHDRFGKLSEEVDELTDLLSQINRKQTSLIAAEACLMTAETIFHRETKGMVCPECQQQLP